MEKIPTAEEVIDKMVKFASVNDTINCTVYSLSQVMIEFAKLHVEAAIKECIECAPSGSSTDTVSYKDVVECLTDCYSLDNIK